MANNTTPFGLIPRKKIGSGPYNGGITQVSVPASDATAIFGGDLVKEVGSSQFINGQVFSDIGQAATGDVFSGVVVGFLADTRDSLVYRAASTTRIALVMVDHDAEFEVRQVAGGTPLTANDIGLNVNVVVGAGNTFTGQSGMALNNATEAVTNTLDLKIVGMLTRGDNDPGSAPGTGADSSTFVVRINRHRYANQIAGI